MSFLNWIKQLKRLFKYEQTKAGESSLGCSGLSSSGDEGTDSLRGSQAEANPVAQGSRRSPIRRTNPIVMETIIRLKRKWFTDKSSIGELYFDNSTERVCYTLEDCLRLEKIHGETCIPAGRYEVVFSFSNRFKKFLPLLIDVPNFEGVRIRPGNTAADTEGCILPGFEKAEDLVTNSRAAFSYFFASLNGAMQNGKVFIEITNEPEKDTRTVA
jgi:hypothetical protein